MSAQESQITLATYDQSIPENALPESLKPVAKTTSSYRQILSSSAVIGGSSVLNIAFGVVRVKALAVLLGPAGFGLAGLYNSISEVTQSIAGLGINSSGVRQIAEAVGTKDSERIARTATVLRRMSLALGVIGALVLIIFARPISKLTFGGREPAWALCLLSLAVLFRLVSNGQAALIQGMRRIRDLAKMNILGAFLGTILSIGLVYRFRQSGIVLSIVMVAAAMSLTSFYYSRKVRCRAPVMSIAQMAYETGALLKLGVAFMASGLMIVGAGYIVRLVLLRRVGFEATGFYQSAWMLGGMYVGFILQAMAADFYPRLTACANDNAECNRLVNEQALVGMLLAGPGVLATLTCAPLVLSVFYSSKFYAAAGVLRLVCIGTILQVISWPMGFIVLAKGKQNVFFLSELAWTVVHVGLAFTLVRKFGLSGAGLAFFGSYVFHVCLIYPIVRVLSGFRWTAINRTTSLIFLSLIGTVYCGFLVLPTVLATCIGVVVLLTATQYSIRTLATLVSDDAMPRFAQRILRSLTPFVKRGADAS